MFTKRIGKYGLLCKPNTDEGKWQLVLDVQFMFNTKEEALEKALQFVSTGEANYLYKPALIEVSYTYPEEESND